MIIPLGELIQKGFKLYRDNFIVLLQYLLLTVAPMVVFFLIAAPIYWSGQYLDLLGNLVLLLIIIPLALLIGFLLFLLSLWFNFNLMRAVHTVYLGKKAKPLKESLKESIKVLWPGLGTTILAGLYITGPLLVAGVLGLLLNLVFAGNTFIGIFVMLLFIYAFVHAFYFSIRLVFAVYESVLNNVNIKESIASSQKLTNGRWLEVFFGLLVPALIVWIGLMILNFVIMGLTSLLGNTGELVAGLISYIISFLVTPLTMAYVIILFVEAKKNPAKPKA